MMNKRFELNEEMMMQVNGGIRTSNIVANLVEAPQTNTSSDKNTDNSFEIYENDGFRLISKQF